MSRILNRLLLWQKFAVLAAMLSVMVAAPLVIYLQASNKAIAQSRTQVTGVLQLDQLLKVVSDLQMHRGLSAIMLGGNASVSAQLSGKTTDANAAIAQCGNLFKRAGKTEVLASWQQITKEWAALLEQMAQSKLTAKQSFTAHTALIARLFALKLQLMRDYGLDLADTNLSHDMMVSTFTYSPALAEDLGRMRALGSGALASGQLDDTARANLGTLVANANATLGDYLHAMDHIGASSDALKATYAAPLNEAARLVKAALAATRQEVLTPAKLTYKATDFFALMTRAIDAQSRLNSVASAQTIAMVKSTASALRLRRMQMLALLAVLGSLVGALTHVVIRTLTRAMQQAVRLTEHIAKGHLGNSIAVHGTDEVSQLLAALQRMDIRLADTVSEVRRSATSVGNAARQIAQGNDDLSQRTQEQASSLEETAASMEQMTSTVKQNAENASHADELARSATEQAVLGGEIAGKAALAMGEVSASSRKIADIVGLIQEIAFQTNLLALNAAVEAARAGEQGRGFAVVATEVRSLAQRSALAAKEIKALIEDSAEKVDNGSALVDQSGKALAEIVGSVKKVSDIVAEIAAASQEQSSGIDQVNSAVMQMDEVTQQNAALVEEAAAASRAMQEQGHELLQQVAFFRIGDATASSAQAEPAGAVDDDKTSVPAQLIRAAERAGRAGAPLPQKTGEWSEF